MSNDGYIKIHRKILDWEWYKDVNTLIVFVHCLLRANYKEQRFMGHIVPRGSFVTSIKNFSDECNLSIQQTRTALEHLKSTNEITSESTNEFTIINVVNYSVYQDNDFEINKQNNKRITNEQQTTNKRLTTIEKKKESNKSNKGNNIESEDSLNYFTDEKLNSTFNEYLNLRKKMKMQNTERAIQLLINKLEPYDDGIKILMLENAIVNNWKSVYPIKEENIDTLKRLIENEERRNNENDNGTTTNFSELPF